MFRLFRVLFSFIAVLAAGVLGNWVGDRVRESTGETEPIYKTALNNPKEDGEIVIAVAPVWSHLLPAVLFSVTGRPRWMSAFVGGVLASLLIADRYEHETRQRIDEVVSDLRNG
jgi:hypothetical protein